MGKRSRRGYRSKPGKIQRKNPKARSPSVIEGPGFRMVRRGRFIHSEVRRSDEEHRQIVEAIAHSEVKQREGLLKQVTALENDLRRFDTFAILSALSLINHLVDPETYSEVTHPGKSVVVEYATLLALKSAYSTGDALYPDGATLSRVNDELYDAVRSGIWLQMARDAQVMLATAANTGAATPTPGELGTAQMAMRLHELGVRNPAYFQHHRYLLSELFAPFDSELVQRSGFAIEDAIALSSAIPRRLTRLSQERLTKASLSAKELQEEVNRARRGPERKTLLSMVASGDTEKAKHAKFILDLAERSREEVRRYSKFAMSEWILLCASDICCFTMEELAAEAGVSPERAKTFLEAFSIEFGSVPVEFAEMSQTHPLRTRPVLHHQGTYLCPAIMLLDWAIQPKLESILKASVSVWERYHKNRHQVVVNEAVSQLVRMMPGCSYETNLYYGDGNETEDTYELDAFLRFDSMAFFVEVKAQELTDPAMRGAPDRLKRTLTDVIVESHDQAVRAKSYVESARENRLAAAIFRRRDGSTFDYHVEGQREVVLLSVTLAPLGHITAQLHAETSLGLFQKNEFSWVVNIYDLMVIADIIELPAAFPHYVTRRVAAARHGFLEATDELDIFGYYLKEGLYLDEPTPTESTSGRPTLRLASYTVPFDDYFAFTTGIRETPAPKPTQRIPNDLKGLLLRIHASRLPDRLTVSMAILDLDWESREAFAKQIERARKISKRERRASNATVAGPEQGGWGISYWCDVNADAVGSALPSYCERKRKERNAARWFGIGETWLAAERKVAAIVVLA